MAGIHVAALIVFLILVGVDAGQPSGTSGRFAAAAGWFLAGIFLAPLITIGAIIWSTILRRRTRTTAPPSRAHNSAQANQPVHVAQPRIAPTRPEKPLAPRIDADRSNRASHSTRAEARTAAAADKAEADGMVARAANPAPPPSPPGDAVQVSSRGPYTLLGSDKYKSTEVEGEFARTAEIAAVVRALTGRPLRLDHEVEIPYVPAVLRTEPDNRYHRRAIMVVIEGSHVGYLARDDADRYHAAITRVERAGFVPTTRARLWAVQRRGWDEAKKVHARVSLALNEPHLLHPVNEPPTVPYSLLPWGNAVQVTGEENHLEAISPHVNPGSESIAIGTIHRVETTSARGIVKHTVEVRIDGRAVGSLTATTSPHFLPAIEHLERDGLAAATWVKVKGSAIAAQVTAQAARASELSPEWFAGPTTIPSLS